MIPRCDRCYIANGVRHETIFMAICPISVPIKSLCPNISIPSHFSHISPPQLPPGDIKGYENRLALDAKSQLGRAKDLAPRKFERLLRAGVGCWNEKNHIWFVEKSWDNWQTWGFDEDLPCKNIGWHRDLWWFAHTIACFKRRHEIVCVGLMVLSLGQQRFSYPYPCFSAPAAHPAWPSTSRA